MCPQVEETPMSRSTLENGFFSVSVGMKNKIYPTSSKKNKNKKMHIFL